MPVNPQVQLILAQFAQMPAIDFNLLTADMLRAINDRPIALGEPIAMARVEQIELPLPGRTLAARLYVPHGADPAPPLVVYCHGGGWVMGTLDTHDGTCRALAQASGAALLSVAYRLAPEHRYPAAVDDCYDALVWAQANAAAMGCDPHRLAVAGDSAGANLAGAVAILARDRAGPALRHQLLLYPVTEDDFSLTSYAANGGGEFFLSQAMMHWFWEQYLGGQDDAPLARIGATADLSGLPPATVITAEFDPLRDEGMAYARRLEQAGDTVDAATAPGMIHGFVSMYEMVPDVMEWIDRAGANLRRDLAG